MQISRHWRMNSQRYRLMGIRYENGDVSLQNRPVMVEVSKPDAENEHTQKQARCEATPTAA